MKIKEVFLSLSFFLHLHTSVLITRITLLPLLGSFPASYFRKRLSIAALTVCEQCAKARMNLIAESTKKNEEIKRLGWRHLTRR